MGPRVDRPGVTPNLLARLTSTTIVISIILRCYVNKVSIPKRSIRKKNFPLAVGAFSLMKTLYLQTAENERHPEPMRLRRCSVLDESIILTRPNKRWL